MATFGDLSQGNDGFPCSDGRCLVGGPFTLSEAGTLNFLAHHFRPDSTAGTSFKGVILANNGGVPGAVLFVTAAAAIPAGGGWVNASFAGQNISAGSYFLGMVANSFTANSSHDTTQGASSDMLMANGSFSYTSPPATWPGTDGTYDSMPSVYVDYTPAGAGGIVGNAAITTAAATLVAAAILAITGNAAITTADATVNSQSGLPVAAVLAATTADASVAASGSVRIAASLAQPTAAATLAAGAYLGLRGDLAVSTDPATLVAGSSGGIGGQSNILTDDATLAAAATLPLRANGQVTTAPATLSATGSAPGSAYLGVQTQAAALQASGKLAIAGNVAIVTAAATLVSSNILVDLGAFQKILVGKRVKTLRIEQKVTISPKKRIKTLKVML